MSPAQERLIAEAIADGHLVKAIGLVRAATGASLADAKLYVASLASLSSARKSRIGSRVAGRRRVDSSLAKFTFVLTFVLTILIVLAGLAGAVALLANSSLFPA